MVRCSTSCNLLKVRASAKARATSKRFAYLIWIKMMRAALDPGQRPNLGWRGLRGSRQGLATPRYLRRCVGRAGHLRTAIRP